MRVWKFLSGVLLVVAGVFAVAAQSGVFNRDLPIPFFGDFPLKLENLRTESWQQAQLGLDSARLVLKEDGVGVVTVDLGNSKKADAFLGLSLQILSHKAFRGSLTEHLSISASNDGRDWTKLVLAADGRGKELTNGYLLSGFQAQCMRPYRFLAVRIDGITAKQYWQFQLAGLVLRVNGEAESGTVKEAPRGKPFESVSPAVGARILLKLHTLGQGKAKLHFCADGVEVASRWHDGKADNGGWRERTVEVWSDNPFKKLEIAAAAEPEWAVKIEKVEFITNRSAYELKTLGPVPLYHLAVDEKRCRVDRVYASYLQDRDAVASDDFSRVKWGSTPLSEQGFRGPNWNAYTILREPGREVLAALYRFRAAADFDPENEEIRLTLPQSAFVTTVYLDGKKIAESHEGFLPVSFLLGREFGSRREHEIIIKVAGYRFATDAQGKVLFPIGAMAPWTCGITQPPVLERQPKLRAEEIFVHSTSDSVLIDAEIRNRTAILRSGTADVVIFGPDGGYVFHKKVPFRVEADGAQKIEVEFPAGGKLRKWDIGEPNLYFARIELDSGDAKTASEPVHFGWRTIEVRGDSLYLNGRKIRLKGPWAHIGEWTFQRSWQGRRLDDRELFEALLANGMNAGRLHCQPFNRAFYDAADEAGFLVIAEAALAHRPANQASLDHIDRFVRTLRNHPSIVIWSGSNEFEHWITPRPEKTMDFLLEVQRHIKALDPTRPVQHSGFGDAWGKLDIYSIHYPADSKGFPRTLYWTRNPEILPNKLYRENFSRFNPVGKKPLAYGEERIPVNKVDLSMLFGEQALRARFANKPEGVDSAQRMLARDWALRTRAEREQNVLLICPNVFYLGLDSEFVKQLAKEFRSAGVYPKFRDPVLPAGESSVFPVVLFEDSGKPFSGSVRLELVSDGATLAEARLPFESGGGTLVETGVSLAVPAISGDRQQAVLVTRTFDGNGKEVFRDDSEFLIMARPELSPLNRTLHAWGDTGKLTGFATKYGVKLLPVSSPEQLRGMTRPTLWISSGVSEDELRKYAKTLADLVGDGTRVILDAGAHGAMCLPSDAIWNGDSEAISCIGFVRGSHPVTIGTDDLELRYWGKDLSLTSGVTGKPEHGNFRILVDGGGNCSETYLWELPYGKGSYLVNHLKLLDHADELPQAAALLHRLFGYALGTLPEALQDGAVLGSKDDFTAGLLLDLGWKPAAELPNDPTLAVTGAAVEKLGVARVAELAAGRRNVLLLNVPEKQIPALAVALTGTPLGTGKATLSKDDHFYFQGRKNPVYDGLSSADLNWAKRAELSFRLIPEKPLESGIAHGADACFRKPDGGVVLFLNLPLDRDVPSAGIRSRFLSQLSTNLGVRLAAKKLKNQDLSAVRNTPIELDVVANASRECYFGKSFPSGNVNLCGVPFRLPVTSEAKSANFFRFNARSKFRDKPEFDTPVDRFTETTPDRVVLPLDRVQAESIFFLHAATRNWKLERFRSGDRVGEYRVLFEDGSFARIPLLFGINLGCVRGSLEPVPRARLAGIWPMPPNGDGETAAAFVFEWENPNPEKKIKGIELANGCNVPHDLLLFAITIREPVIRFQ